MPELIRLENVTCRFDRGRITALNGVSLVLQTGELVSIVGRSGSGKTTLLNVMAGLIRPDEGATFFEGHAVTDPAAWTALRACRIGMIFQHFNLLPTLTAAENVEVPMHGVERSAHRRRQRALDVLEEVGLRDRSSQYPTTMSGGERQRVAIARSLVNQPRLLLADEPTGNLDTETSAAIADLLLQLHRNCGATLVQVTHDPTLAGRLTRRLRMQDGRLGEAASPADAAVR